MQLDVVLCQLRTGAAIAARIRLPALYVPDQRLIALARVEIVERECPQQRKAVAAISGQAGLQPLLGLQP